MMVYIQNTFYKNPKIKKKIRYSYVDSKCLPRSLEVRKTAWESKNCPIPSKMKENKENKIL